MGKQGNFPNKDGCSGLREPAAFGTSASLAWTGRYPCDISRAFNRDSTHSYAHPVGVLQGLEIMNVTETNAEGLSRTFKVIVPASELVAKLDSRIEEIRPQMNLKGFRPGKVPTSHVKKMFGKSIMSELIEGLVAEANQKAMEDANVRPASQPDVQMDGDIEQVLEGNADLAYSLNVDVMPEFEPTDIKVLKIERPVSPVADEQIDEALQNLAEQNVQYEARGKTAKAKDGDAVVIAVSYTHLTLPTIYSV